MHTPLVHTTSLLLAGAVTMTALAADAGRITPRTPLAKRATDSIRIPVNHRGEVVATGRLVVKFNDSVRARTTRTPATRVVSANDENLAIIDELIDKHRLTVRQAINQPAEKLAQLEQRAMAHSLRAQPDLAGMMYLEGPLERLLEAARELNPLPQVEFCYFEEEMVYHVPEPAPRALLGGVDPVCGDPGTGDCFDPDNGSALCDDAQCCTDVGALLPDCVDIENGIWDQACVNIANLICEEGDRCASPINGPCVEPHPLPGCSDEACCNLVCEIEIFCCEIEWDQECVILGTQTCEVPGVGVTPDFTMDSAVPENRLQKYLTPEPLTEGAFLDRTNTDGRGLTLAQLQDLGQTLLDEYGIGEANGARGLGIRVGVVEHTAHVTGPKVAEGGRNWHEDLEDVIPEPNQTILTIEGGVLSPDHGTATLGQIVAADNGIGVTGIAKDAQGYFFPIVSAEEGGRTFGAIIAALQTFEPGDVLNYSIGPGGGGTLVSNEGTWTLIRLGTDLGITSVISAGNDCFNLDTNGQANGQDSGAIIVGAATSGDAGQGVFCRLGFSNHCGDCEPTGGLVHCSAWGHNVTTTGYGNLFTGQGTDGTPVKARAYSASFNGTSSAAPIIAGLATCLQGLAKQFYGTPLPPGAIRAVIANNGTPQCGIDNPANIPGAPDGLECLGDFDPDEDANLIGGFPNAFEAGIGVIAGNFFAQSPATDFKVITGTQLGGNVNSIKASDNSYLSIESATVGAGGQGQGFGPAIKYLTAGQTTDLQVTGFTNLMPEQVAVLGVINEAAVTQNFVLTAQYIYNWSDGRWTLLPNIGFAGTGDAQNGGVVEDAPAHVSPEGVIFVRVWTCGLGAVPAYTARHDLVDILISQDPNFNPFPDG